MNILSFPNEWEGRILAQVYSIWFSIDLSTWKTETGEFEDSLGYTHTHTQSQKGKQETHTLTWVTHTHTHTKSQGKRRVTYIHLGYTDTKSKRKESHTPGFVCLSLPLIHTQSHNGQKKRYVEILLSVSSSPQSLQHRQTHAPPSKPLIGPAAKFCLCLRVFALFASSTEATCLLPMRCFLKFELICKSPQATKLKN